MKHISFLGSGSGEVTGSSYLVTADDANQILVDFGMFQGNQDVEAYNFQPLAFNPASLQGVFLTHAHLDHCGRLPLLIFGGFAGKVYMTAPTKSLVEIILRDSARIAEKERPENPLYTIDEVEKLLQKVEIVQYNKQIDLGSFTAVFRDAGHILGSASIEITDISTDEKQKIVFSGDLGNTPQHIVKPTQYIHAADFVVMESTYGDASHPKEDPAAIIQEEINAVEESGGTLLIPAFAIERTQELLHIIHHLKKDGKIRSETPVFLDSPMGIDVTVVYLNFKDFCNEEMQNHTEIPYNFEGVEITYDAKNSKAIFTTPGAKVIIAGSGMMAGGRILHHAINYLGQQTTRVLFVGYQAEETLGRKILEGAGSVLINNEAIPVKAHITEIKTLSSHADQPRLLTWLGHIKGVKKVFLTHGEDPQRSALAEKIKAELHLEDIALPKINDELSLG